MDYQKNEQIEETDSLHVDTDSQKLKVYQNIFGTAWSKMSGQSDHGTIKLTVFQK